MSDLDELERLAKAQASGYARMLELDGGIGKLGVEHPEMHDDMLAWQEATEDEHADTVLSLVARVREAESVIEEALEAFRKPYENTTQPNSRMTAVLGILSTYEKGAAQ